MMRHRLRLNLIDNRPLIKVYADMPEGTLDDTARLDELHHGADGGLHLTFSGPSTFFLILAIHPQAGEPPIPTPRYPTTEEEFDQHERRTVDVRAQWRDGAYTGEARLDHLDHEPDGGVNFCVSFLEGYRVGEYILLEVEPVADDAPIPFPVYPDPATLHPPRRTRHMAARG